MIMTSNAGVMFVTEKVMRKGSIHIGTSGWSYKDWPGIFYPPDLKSGEWLTYYATYFDTTEINSSFYRLPLKKTVADWAKKVPDNFKFCPKMSRYLTHIKRLKEPEEPLERFFDIFSPLKEQLGPVLVQLPATVKFDPEVAEHFFALLKRGYSEYDFVFEARHASWHEDDAIELLRTYNVGFVISQSGVGFPYAEVITSDIVYFRFHGPGKLYFSSYSDEMLAAFANKFKKWEKQGKHIWIFFNNTPHAYGVHNADTLEDLIKTK
jgi:uncharacterized protein YecE (DUF72 family)